MSKSIFILQGNIVYSKSPWELAVCRRGYVVCQDGYVKGVYQTLPFRLGGNPIADYGDCLIIPGLVDLHVHASQYAVRGTGMDRELLEWLETTPFPEEAKFADPEYAQKAYRIFAEDLKKSPVTRACIFATVHRKTVLLLMDLLEKSGLDTFVGKVNMDRNCPDYLREDTEQSVAETEKWIREAAERNYKNTRPILTPRFIPSCTNELLDGLKQLQRAYGLPVQSHLSENPEEIGRVKELRPEAEFYGDAYDRSGLFGGDCRTIMAHCVYSTEKEIKRMQEKGVFLAHCPESNMNLASGIAPVRSFLDRGMHVGLGSDVAAGSSLNMFAAMRQALQASKMRWRIQDKTQKPLTLEEVFYMATRGGGKFFGKVGSFEPGYEFDAVVLDDSRLQSPEPLDIRSRLERLIWLGDEREVREKYVKGVRPEL